MIKGNGEMKRLGILVGGGPAPGINSAISAVTIEAINSGLEVIGIYDGFEHLIDGQTDGVRQLHLPDMTRIHSQGGSILRTSRANPTGRPEYLERTVQAIRQLGISLLVTIGGDDTAFAASKVSKRAGDSIRVAHIPKTIDNDLPLPDGMPTFGFETARHVGTELALNLLEDARTTNRWYFMLAMGRKAGHLALGIGKSAGASLTLIPEEFSKETLRLQDVSRVLEGAILKRRVMGLKHGLAVIAEGIGEKLDLEELATVPGVVVDRDPYGHILLSEIPLATILRRHVQRQFAERGDQISILDVTAGYSLRCAPPIPFDVDYTRTLGYGAVRFLMSPNQDEQLNSGGMVCLQDGHLRVLPFESLRDPDSGRTRIRFVDMESEHYKVTRSYMTRLEKQDLLDDEARSELEKVAKMPQGFFGAFAPVVGIAE